VLQLPQLPRYWPSIDLPGYRERHTTYASFDPHGLPPIERELDDEVRWLLREPAARRPLEGTATLEQLDPLVAGQSSALPPAFTTFIASGEARARIRSCTDCYVRLAEFAVPVEGGTLVNFLSDSQSVIYWLLYCGPGGEAVVVTSEALGFYLGDDDAETKARDLDLTSTDACVCAESFSEFLYRFWIENEIWFRLVDLDGDEPPLTDEQRSYAEHYSCA
jgi:hypothetical protein